MRRFQSLGLLPGALLFAACSGGQSTTDPCVRTIDVLDAPAILVSATTTVHATVKNKSGSCSGNEPVSWVSSNSQSAEILSATDSTASVRGKAAGKPNIVAFLSRFPTVRDSIILTVNAPTDANRASSQ